jgi:hypothetical protein
MGPPDEGPEGLLAWLAALLVLVLLWLQNDIPF